MRQIVERRIAVWALVLTACTVCTALILFGMIHLFSPKTDALIVQSVRWKYTIEIEKLETFEESGWSLPAGARFLSKQTELFAFCGKVPLYRTKYYYEIERWSTDRMVETGGTGCEPFWGDADLNRTDERIGQKSESYMINAVNAEGRTKTYFMQKDDWKNTRPGDVLDVLIHIGDTIEIQKRNGAATNTENAKSTILLPFTAHGQHRLSAA